MNSYRKTRAWEQQPNQWGTAFLFYVIFTISKPVCRANESQNRRERFVLRFFNEDPIERVGGRGKKPTKKGAVLQADYVRAQGRVLKACNLTGPNLASSDTNRSLCSSVYFGFCMGIYDRDYMKAPSAQTGRVKKPTLWQRIRFKIWLIFHGKSSR